MAWWDAALSGTLLDYSRLLNLLGAAESDLVVVDQVFARNAPFVDVGAVGAVQVDHGELAVLVPDDGVMRAQVGIGENHVGVRCRADRVLAVDEPEVIQQIIQEAVVMSPTRRIRRKWAAGVLRRSNASECLEVPDE